MRKVILADTTWSPEEHPEVKVRYGALTPHQFRRAEAIKEQWFADHIAKHGIHADAYRVYCTEWIDYINRHGVRSIKGLEVQEPDGSVRELKIEAEHGIDGLALTESDYEEVSTFFDSMALAERALAILALYQSKSSKSAGSTPTR